MPSRKVKRTELSSGANRSAGLARHFPALGILAQGMHGSCGQVELLAGQDDQALEGGTGHGAGGCVHALGQRCRGVVIAAAGVGEEQERVTVEGPVAAQFLILTGTLVSGHLLGSIPSHG
jgi:hypothetical protein